MFVSCENIFSIPLYKFKFKYHDVLKGAFVKFAKDESIYEYESDIRLSRKNLHQEKLFQPITTFFGDSLNYTMKDLGFAHPCRITSLWISEQKYMGKMRAHKHNNSFLVGVYYLDGDSDSPGTSMMNLNMGSIIPQRSDTAIQKMPATHSTEFEEGAFYVFPSFVVHYTEQLLSKESRYVLAVNSMPIFEGNNSQDHRRY